MRRRAFGLRPVPSLPSRPFGFNPSRLRACGAARFACLQGVGARPIPAALSLAPLNTVEPACAGSTRPVPRCNRQGMADTPWLAAAGCARACLPQRWRFLPITSRHEERFTNTPPSLAMEFSHHASRPLPLSEVGTLSPVVGRLTRPASGCAPLKLPCGDAELSMSPFGGRFGPRRPWLVVNPGGGTAAPRASWLQPSGANNFPAAARLPRGTNSFRLLVLHCVATASGAARPSPAGRITTRTRWARTLFNRKEI